MANKIKGAKTLGLLVGCLCITACNTSYSQMDGKRVETTVDEAKVSVMLLGVYHFDNPGLDKHNLTIDDYFSERRQSEIAQVVEKLSRFRPTKVFVELKPEAQPSIDSLYSLFLKDELSFEELNSGRNEVYQIGFRLAKKGQLEGVACIDADGFWLGPYADFIADTLDLDFYKQDEFRAAKNHKETNQLVKERSVLENLVATNQWAEIMADHNYYNDIAIRVKDTVGILFTNQDTTLNISGKEYQMRSFDFENIGVELVAEWYKRNFFIYRNILEKARPGDRVVVIIGQGHVRILHHLLSDNPNFEVVSPLRYLRGK